MTTLYDHASHDEAKRLEALRRYDILDTPPDGAFDRITTLAANLFDVPISIISLVDHDRIWFKSRHGLDVEEIPREPGLCASAILKPEPWLLTDAAIDPRSLANPLVAGDFGLRFYLGVPLRTHDGHNLGTLCVIDRLPREVDERQVTLLENLADIVMDEMELRLSTRSTVRRLEEALAEKELMAKEVEHRVMNSLQLVASMLKLQSRNAEGEAAEQLAYAANRVAAVGRVHQHLAQKDGIGRTDARRYLEGICGELSSLFSGEDGSIIVTGDDIHCSNEQIVSVGLIVSELVTNAVKHGGRRIDVSIRCEGDVCLLRVSDDGNGLPPDFDPALTRGFGMKVISSLTTRLDGELDCGNRETEKGARFTVRFKLD